MIDQGLAAAAIVYASVLAGIGAIVLLALAAWWVRSPLTSAVQRRAADRGSRRENDAPQLTGTPHPAH
jgi:hypothetical protein